ncbi:hypothetical protein AMTRI_Chr02g212780 [Amborella trichopoda]
MDLISGDAMEFISGDEPLFSPFFLPNLQTQDGIPTDLDAPPAPESAAANPPGHPAPAGGCRKIPRGEVERQRRSEMAALCVSLRSLLPIEYLRGKRSTSDQMNQAASYITHLQKKIEELVEVRDNLKRACKCGFKMSPDTCRGVMEQLEVRECGEGVEVVMGGPRGAACASRVVGAIEEESMGLEVVSYVYTTTGDRSFDVVKSRRSARGGGATADIRKIKRQLVQALHPHH